MKTAPVVALSTLVVAVAITACNAANEPPAVTPSPTQALTAAVPPVTPTPIAPGRDVTYDNLQVTMDKYEFSNEYTTEYGIVREPPAGKKFLWVHVVLKNVGNAVHNVPRPEHFSVLYYNTELKASYGHRQDFPDYTALGDVTDPGHVLAAWLRFEIPVAAEFPELLFAFIPESSRVSFNTSYAWANHPVYLWALAP